MHAVLKSNDFFNLRMIKASRYFDCKIRIQLNTSESTHIHPSVVALQKDNI